MNIQVIGTNWGNRAGFKGIEQSSLSGPRSLDEFDVNIIDLSCDQLWCNDDNTFASVNAINDLRSINQMVVNSEKTKIVYVLPQNSKFLFYYDYRGQPQKSIMIKDHLETIQKSILNVAITPQLSANSLLFEKTRTDVAGIEYEADLYFRNHQNNITASKCSNKVTTVSTHSRVLVTTLNITCNLEKLLNYVSFFFEESTTSESPDWFDSITFYDDVLQSDVIAGREQEIRRAQQAIEEANKKLQENNRYKSILYTNGNELVEVVFDMLEQLLGCDLSEFEDKKNEDFLIRINGNTLIGEIKGVTSNIKNDHIGQIEHHYQRYMDELEEKGITENVHQVLIISPFRTKEPNVREPVNEKQINLAKRNGCLIIETQTLLRIFEKYLEHRITSEQCVGVFCSKTGLLQIADFSAEQQGEIEAFKV